MKLKQLEGYLGQVKGFPKPKILLEQYVTQPHIAARILYTIDSHYDDLEDQIIGDLGCGSGALTVGASMLGAASCVSVDIDDEALAICQLNCEEFDLTNVEFVNGDVTTLPFRPGTVDTVIMNPPFGTKHNQGIDMLFLKQAIDMSENVVYSLHKTTTREHIKKKATDWKMDMEVVAELRFDLPASYKFHKQKSRDVAVDFLRFSHHDR